MTAARVVKQSDTSGHDKKKKKAARLKTARPNRLMRIGKSQFNGNRDFELWPRDNFFAPFSSFASLCATGIGFGGDSDDQ